MNQVSIIVIGPNIIHTPHTNSQYLHRIWMVATIMGAKFGGDFTLFGGRYDVK